MAPHPGAAEYAPHKADEAAESLADSMAAWKKDGLEPLGEPAADTEADGLLRSLPATDIKHMRNPTVPSNFGEKHNGKADESSQADSKNSEKAGETPKEVPIAHEHIESIFCHGIGCMIGIMTILVAVPAAIMLCSLAICWWCERRRRISGDRQERAGLITYSESQTSSPEPALQ